MKIATDGARLPKRCCLAGLQTSERVGSIVFTGLLHMRVPCLFLQCVVILSACGAEGREGLEDISIHSHLTHQNLLEVIRA